MILPIGAKELAEAGMDAHLEYIPDAQYICHSRLDCLQGISYLYSHYPSTKYIALQPLTMADCFLDTKVPFDGDWLFGGLNYNQEIIESTLYETNSFSDGIFYECSMMRWNNNMTQILILTQN